MVRVGIAGIGFMGVTHFKAYQQVDEARVAAIFTRDERKLAGDWSDVRGNFGGAGGTQDLTGIRRHNSLESLLQDGDIDLVDICLPTHLHRSVAEQALAAGKHVLVEKPVALNLEDADAMIAAGRRSGRLLMVAQVLRFWPEFALLASLIESEEHGPLRALHFKRVIAQPDWSGDNWFSDSSRTGGPVVDLHIHDSDFIRHLFGMPQSVRCSGRGQGSEIDYIVSAYSYDNRDAVITSQCGAVAQKGREFEHGFEAYFERAMLTYNSTSQPIPQLVRGSEVEELQPSGEDGFAAQCREVAAAVTRGEAGEMLDPKSARDSLALVLAEAEAVRTGEPVRVRGN